MTLSNKNAILSLIIFIYATFAAVEFGLGWFVLHSQDVCNGPAQQYIVTVTHASTAFLVVYGTGLLIILMTVVCTSLELLASSFCVAVVLILAIISAIVNLIWFIWGVVVLSDENNCKGTAYFAVAVVLVVLNGLQVLGNRLRIDGSGISSQATRDEFDAVYQSREDALLRR